MKPSAILVEDDNLLRSALVTALRGQGIMVIGDFPTAEGVLEFASASRPDVALLDLDLGPGPTGIDVARALRDVVPTIGLVILTTYTDPRLKTAESLSLPRGAAYLNKNDAHDVGTVAIALARAHQDPLTLRSRAQQPTPMDLTHAQIAVLQMVSEGLTNAQIAVRRGVTINAVEQMLAKMYQRLDVPESAGSNQRVQLVRAYLKGAGLLD